MREGMLKPVEGVFAFVGQSKGNVILREMNKRFRYNTVVLNEASIKITKTEEGLNSFDYSGVLLLSDDIDFARVDFQSCR